MQKTDEPMQDTRKANIDAIVAFFESGISKGPGEIGIELEHTIVKNDGCQPVSYREERGIQWLLHQLNATYPQTTFDAEGDLIGVSAGNEYVTIEPAAQLELSAGPFKYLHEASRCFENFDRLLTATLNPVDEKVVLLGYHPTGHMEQLELIPKKRYRFMDRYFRKIGPYGACMMRGSGSMQISIDYNSVDDCLRKLKLAFALVPLFSLISDNAPVFEGKPRPHKMIRTKIWQECDPDRCGLVPGVMEDDFTLRDYAEYVLDTPAILYPCPHEEWCYTEKTFAEIYADRIMEEADVEHALSMLFNDVRLKTYIEIRPADAMPIPYVISYAALIKGLFYSESNLQELDTLFAGVKETDIESAKEALMGKGYEASVYGVSAASLGDRLIELAYKGLDDDEKSYLEPLASLVRQRMTLADKIEQHLCRPKKEEYAACPGL